jgi:ribonuclease BN (tRNA processing enzyme)
MPSVSFLGTGSGLPSADRFFSSSLLLLGGKHLLIDAGEPCVHLLRDRGGLIREIDAVLLTHGHVDHVGGIPALLQGCMLLERTKELVIYLPVDMVAPLRVWIGALHLTEEGLGFPVTWVPWEDRKGVSFGDGIIVTPWPNNHLAECYRSLPGADAGRPCHSYSLEIEAGDFRGIFSGDLCGAGDLVPLVKEPVTVLVSELSHFGAEELASVLASATIHALCLVHLSEEYASNRADLRARLEDLLPKVGDVFLPEDGEVIDF